MDAVVRRMAAEEMERRLPELLALQERAARGAHPGRREIVRRHAGYPGFRALVAEDPAGRLLGFAYGYRSMPGQWWHGQVRRAIGADVARDVLDGGP